MSSLQLEGIDKRFAQAGGFGFVRAVDGASITISEGLIHAVVGENGAGKSTLLKIAAGILAPDAGHVRVRGELLAPHTAAEAIRRGISMVQQHFALVGAFTGLENLILGAEPVRGKALPFARLDFVAARSRAQKAARELGAPLPLDARVDTLGVGDRQRLEIARALFHDARVVILDEPTAVLTPAESAALFATLRRLADAGRSIVVVTHKLDEVTAYADRVTVMRKGTVVNEGELGPGDAESLARMIMGGEAPQVVRRSDRGATGSSVFAAGLVLTEVSLERRGIRDSTETAPALANVSFEVRAGEVVGIAGVEGNGQRELVRVLAGLEAPTSGTITGARSDPPASVVHEDRQVEGLVLGAGVTDNLLLGELARFTRAGFLNLAAMDAEAAARADRMGVGPQERAMVAHALSGGNQQKIVVGRALARRSPVLVVAHPTRGVDFHARHVIHSSILEAAEAGTAVLVVSSDLQELRTLSDRILVMVRGAIVAELPKESSDAEIGARMVGAFRSPGAPEMAP